MNTTITLDFSFLANPVFLYSVASVFYLLFGSLTVRGFSNWCGLNRNNTVPGASTGLLAVWPTLLVIMVVYYLALGTKKSYLGIDSVLNKICVPEQYRDK